MKRGLVSAPFWLCIGLYVACHAPTVATVTTGTTAAVCIEQAALKGETIAQISADCFTDVAQVIGTLIDSKNAQVRASSAGSEAIVARRAITGDAGK